MSNKVLIKLLAVLLALAMPLATAVIVFAGGDDPQTGSSAKVSKYDSLDINKLTGHGEEPEEISVTAGTSYQEKAWYEYVLYSDHAICSYRADDDTRILFYDPYTYTNSMVMDVEFDAKTTEFDTMSSYSVSHTNTTTMSSCVTATETYSNATQTSGRDITGTEVENGGYTKTKYNHTTDTTAEGEVVSTNEYEYSRVDYTNHSMTISETFGSETKIAGNPLDCSETIKAGFDGSDTWSDNVAWLTNKTTNTTEYGDGYKTTTNYSGDDTVENHTTSSTEGWTELSARITKTIGSSTSTSNTWSESTGTTVTKTYAATHFASDGVTPLPWAIVHYRVQMPMKCCLQIRYSGEWITVSTTYCLLTTVHGTCRAWMQEGEVYYEDWGNGSPVVATDFWSQFMTREQLIRAYSGKLYPVGGEN